MERSSTDGRKAKAKAKTSAGEGRQSRGKGTGASGKSSAAATSSSAASTPPQVTAIPPRVHPESASEKPQSMIPSILGFAAAAHEPAIPSQVAEVNRETETSETVQLGDDDHDQELIPHYQNHPGQSFDIPVSDGFQCHSVGQDAEQNAVFKAAPSLSQGDRVQVNETIGLQPRTPKGITPRPELQFGESGLVARIDGEGDALVQFSHGFKWIPRSDFSKFDIEATVAAVEEPLVHSKGSIVDPFARASSPADSEQLDVTMDMDSDMEPTGTEALLAEGDVPSSPLPAEKEEETVESLQAIVKQGEERAQSPAIPLSEYQRSQCSLQTEQEPEAEAETASEKSAQPQPKVSSALKRSSIDRPPDLKVSFSTQISNESLNNDLQKPLLSEYSDLDLEAASHEVCRENKNLRRAQTELCPTKSDHDDDDAHDNKNLRRAQTEPLPIKLTEEEKKQQQVDRTVCVGLCCARITCSWTLKLIIVVGFVQYIFNYGALSRTLWLPISPTQACQTNDDGALGPKPTKTWKETQSLLQCQRHCDDDADCQAIDFFNGTGWCNTFDVPCSLPTADWDGAASYMIAQSCNLHNGSSGILIRGKCNTLVQMPTLFGMLEIELETMVTSPRSWLFTLCIALPYVYLKSPPYVKERMKKFIPLTSIAKVLKYAKKCPRSFGLLLTIVVFSTWAYGTFYMFGAPDATKGIGGLSLMEQVWLGVSALGLLMFQCPKLRCCMAPVLSLATCFASTLSSIFVSLVGCFFTAAAGAMEAIGLGSFGLAGAAGTLGTMGTGAAAVAGETAVAAEAGVAAEALAGADGIAAAEGGLVLGDTAAAGGGMLVVDGLAAGGAAAEGAAAGETAIALAEAAAVAETAAEGAAVVVLCVVQ